MEYKVTEKDLIGDIKDFPIEVVQKMVERQVEQGNKADISVFQKNSCAIKKHNGFSCGETIEGGTFWSSILHYNHFDVFFQKYPKQNKVTIQKDMETNKKVWIRGVLGRGYEVINELIKLGGNNHGLSGAILNDIYYIGPDNSIEFIRDDIKRAKEIMAEYKEIKLNDNPSITVSQDYGLKASKNLSTFAKTCINLPEGSSVNICNEKGKVMIIVEPKQVKEEERRFKDGEILFLTAREGRNYIAIFKSEDDEAITLYGWLNTDINEVAVSLYDDGICLKKNIEVMRYAIEEEIVKFNEELANQEQLHWNAEELEFEELRWRAEKGGKYWYIGDDGEIHECTDIRSCFDKSRYNSRNYFRTEELAKKAQPLWKEFFKNLSL